MEYFELIVTNFKLGDKQKAEELFVAMPKKNKKSFIKFGLSTWVSGLTQRNIISLIDFL